ncbi:MAG: GIY-YIG nuclease family protein [Synechococcus sp.]
MSTPLTPTPLAELAFLPFIDEQGLLPQHLSGTVGVYAIFDTEQQLQYIGYSRDVFASLRLHLVRQPHQCYWLKVQEIARPSRTALEGIRSAWVEENGAIPPGNVESSSVWDSPIDVKLQMTEAERTEVESPELDERSRIKALKQVARRVEAEILAVLAERQVKESLRFHPKLKERGLLDLKG